MAESAEVLSLEVLSDLRVALVRFAEDAAIALQDVDFEIRRTLEWLSNEQRLYWQSEIKRWQQKLSMAKTELHRKKLQKYGDRSPDTSQEEKAVRYAEMRLETAQKKLERLKRWVPELQHAVQEYRGLTQSLADAVDMQIPRDLARLDRMLRTLEEYTQLAAPKTPEIAGHPIGSAGAESMSRGEPGSTAGAAPEADEPTNRGNGPDVAGPAADPHRRDEEE